MGHSPAATQVGCRTSDERPPPPYEENVGWGVWQLWVLKDLQRVVFGQGRHCKERSSWFCMYTLVFCLSNIWHSKQRPDWCELAERSGNLALKPCSIQLCSAPPLSSFLSYRPLLCHHLLALSLFPCSVIVPSFSALPLCSPRNIIMTISQLQISIKRSLNTRAHTHSRSLFHAPFLLQYAQYCF